MENAGKCAMTDFSNSECLALWERGYGLHPLDKGLLMLGAEIPSANREHLADWPLGKRNKALARLRCRSFGARLAAWTACSRCGEKLEFELDGRLIASPAGDASAGSTIAVRGRTYRLPTSRDLALAAQQGSAFLASVRIVESCRIDAGDPIEWTEEEVEEVGNRMALADPLAEILMDLTCPECGNRFKEPLDLADFLWSEIEARARRLLVEVHTLAAAYGWTEKEILSLSDHRRQLYLEMVRA
jgi:hypothetical protein